MATKKQDENDGLWGLLIFVIPFAPFLVVAIRHYRRMCADFPASATSQRIFDMMNLASPLFSGATVVIGVLCLVAQASRWSIAILAVPLVALAGIWLSCAIARWVATTYFGVMVDPEKDTVLLPKDMASYGISDYMAFQFIRDLGEVDIIRLSTITKITREAGKRVYIHGPFGSRAMTFSNKQKRDECLAAIERGARGVRPVTDFGY